MKSIFHIVFILFIFSIGACRKETPPKTEKEYSPTPYNLEIPAIFPKPKIPKDNPMTVEGVELGRKLFYDPILSSDNTISCASCHRQEHAFSDPDRFSSGVDGKKGDIRSMKLINLAWNNKFFWNGRAGSLEEQVSGPVTNPVEMNSSWSEVVTKVRAIPEYKEAFKKAFGTDNLDSTHIAKAIAQFERTLISANSKFDKSSRGEYLLTEEEQEGYELFFSEDGDCFHCHGNSFFQDIAFVNNGLDLVPDNGLFDVTNNPKDIGKFKIPTLRNTVFSSPYMHDGRFSTLEEVVEFYSTGVQHQSPNISPLMEFSHNGGVQLTEQQSKSIIAFLKTLSDEEFINNPKFSNPHK